MSDLPYDLILEYLPSDRITVKKMFGHQCLYFDGIMVMFMIAKDGHPDNGICLATAAEHIPSLGRELPSLRHLDSYGPDATGWRLLPADSPSFESDAARACELILAKDPRIGREARGRKVRGPKAGRAKGGPSKTERPKSAGPNSARPESRRPK